MGFDTAVKTTSAAPPQHVIVVLGAGRSGTSTITRGLQTLGVELGDQLRPGGGKNPTGFFEDESLMKINKRLRKALGLRAESVSLIEPQQWQTPTVQAFQQEARETIRRRFGTYSLWGYKYAGTLRLLPFWRMVFHSLDLDVRYVMAVRNPISVARSRAKLNPRRGTQEKSDLEWLVNVVPYFREVRERPFVVVDYDLVLADPVTQLERLATALDLSITATTKVAMQEYADQFLNLGLRHSRFTDEDLDNNLQVNSLTRDAYRWLRRLATDEIDQDSLQFWQEWSRVENALAHLGPILRYLDHVEAELRCAQRSVLGPLQAVPQLWQNLRQNWSLERLVMKLRTAVTREAS
ncbi:MAG: hypothetical protein HY268_06895 [Deltaproteobacteria bacterium]|nr:hypothetical protein [Deltaproteobacteria bacterium]